MWNQEDNKFKPAQPVDASAGRKPAEPAAQFGRSICVKGEVTGSEDLTVDGQVEGRIHLPEHTLTVGPNAMILADVTAKVVTIFGTVVGSITAHDRIDIRKSGSVEGNVSCARLAVQEGAILGGKIETRGVRKSVPRPAAEEEATRVLAPVA